MRNFKGHKALTEGTEAEVESRNLEAKCMYASLPPQVSGYWLLTTGFRLLLFVLFLLATLAPVEFPLNKGGERGLFPWGLGVVDAFAADNGYFTATGSMAILFAVVGLFYCRAARIRFKQVSALRTLKGRFECFVRKCRFSDTSTSAPTHSAYAAMKASAGLNPLISYFAPNSKGTLKSSSISAIFSMNFMNSLNSAGTMLRLTSSMIKRGTEMEYMGYESLKESISDSQTGFLKAPKPNIYSLASRTRRNFFLPNLLSCFTEGGYNFFFGHLGKRMASFGNHLSEFVQMFLGFLGIGLYHSYHLTVITKFNHTGVFLSNNVRYFDYKLSRLGEAVN